MAEEWYLLTTPYDQLSGYEDDAFNDFAEEGFAEALDSIMGSDVYICNSDLSVCTKTRAIIQNRVQDTKLNDLRRHVFTPIGTCKAGNYILYKGRYWLIESIVDDNGIYEKGVMVVCNWKLTWRDLNGNVVQRWASIQSASQYNNGEFANRFFTLRTDQVMIALAMDDASIMLDTGVRFIIDKRIELYENNIPADTMCDTSFDVITYECTRNDSVLYNYIDSGHYQFLATQDEKHNGDGYYVIDGKGYWLCSDDVIEPAQDPIDEDVEASISCDDTTIYIGLDPAIFRASYYNAEGLEIDVPAEWVINCNFEDSLIITYDGNTISIAATDMSLNNKTFDLYLNGYEDETKLTIKMAVLI